MYTGCSDKWIHLCNLQPNQDVENLHHPPKFLRAHPQSVSPTSTPGNHGAAFYHHRLVWLIIELNLSGITQYILFCVWLLQLSIMFLRLTKVFACISHLFILMAEQCSTVWIDHNCLIYSPVDRHLGSFQVLAIVNKTAMNMNVQVILWKYTLISLTHLLRSGSNCFSKNSSNVMKQTMMRNLGEI